MNHVEVTRELSHPRARVFARYTDHERWGEWTGLGRVRLVKDGAPERDGIGAIRAFAAAGPLREEVTGYEAPSRMTYRIAAGGFPITDHHGEVVFEETGAGTRVTWRVRFRSRLPGTGWLIERGLRRLFTTLLGRLARDLDRGSRSGA